MDTTFCLNCKDVGLLLSCRLNSIASFNPFNPISFRTIMEERAFPIKISRSSGNDERYEITNLVMY